jgi:hypothetical protein
MQPTNHLDSHTCHLFIRTIAELRQRSESDDRYEILRISLLLRQLLLDSTPLMDKVNREFRRQIVFEISHITAPTDKSVVFWNVLDGLDPTTSKPGRKKISVDRGQLLSTPVSRIAGQLMTVHDIIHRCAHVLGGVHAGEPKSAADVRLKEISTQIGFDDGVMLQLKSIARVVCRALHPLERDVEVFAARLTSRSTLG